VWPRCPVWLPEPMAEVPAIGTIGTGGARGTGSGSGSTGDTGVVGDVRQDQPAAGVLHGNAVLPDNRPKLPPINETSPSIRDGASGGERLPTMSLCHL
jgi:hypothetical protein